MNYIRAGWDGYRDQVIPKKASTVQVLECERAFFAGAFVLFHGIMIGLDPGEEPTVADMRRMADIEKELADFAEASNLHYTEGPMQ